jgi:hypothetical protein
MCDYSLMMLPNRLAAEGEELVTYKFKSGSVGLLSCRDLECWAARPRGVWQRFKDWLSCQGDPRPVVCVPPGARLRFVDAPKTLRAQLPLGPFQEAVFTQLSAEFSQHRDALCFENGTAVLLQLLPQGQRLKVLWLSSLEETASDRKQAVPTLVG